MPVVAVAAFDTPPFDHTTPSHFLRYRSEAVHFPPPGVYFPVVVNAIHSGGGY